MQLLKEAHDEIRSFADGRDTDLCFLPQKVYNAWFDLDATLRKLRKETPMVTINPSRKEPTDE